jgi:O-antigen ligase
VDVERAMGGWLKLLALCLVALLLSRTLRNRQICAAFGWSLIAASLIIGLFLVYNYAHSAGVAMPSYESARKFKAVALRLGIPLNTIAFASVLSYITGMCLVRTKHYLWVVGILLFVISSVFTGSRAPVATLVVSGVVLVFINAVRSRQLSVRWAAWVLVILVFSATPILVMQVSFKKMSDATEGRWDLWQVALEKFSERPIIGYGYESAHDDLLTRSPGVYSLRGVKATPGGYHNEYLTVLAEEGLVGTVGLVAVSWFLIQACWQLAFCQWHTWHNQQWALFGGLFLLIRGGVEVPGLFGYGREPVDFLAYIFVAIVVSRFSIEEDCALEMLQSAPDLSLTQVPA